MVITVDRMERALEGEKSAVQSVYEKYGVPVYSIVNMEDIIQGIRDEVIPGQGTPGRNAGLSGTVRRKGISQTNKGIQKETGGFMTPSL